MAIYIFLSFQKVKIPSAQAFRLYDFKFDDFSLDDDGSLKVSVEYILLPQNQALYSFFL